MKILLLLTILSIVGCTIETDHSRAQDFSTKNIERECVPMKHVNGICVISVGKYRSCYTQGAAGVNVDCKLFDELKSRWENR